MSISADELRQTLAQIQSSIAEVQKSSVKKEDLTSVVNAAVQTATAPLVSRIESCESATQSLREQISTLSARFDAIVELTSKQSKEPDDMPGAKRMCATPNAHPRGSSVPPSNRSSVERSPAVVITGFPRNSKKKAIEDVVNNVLKSNTRWQHLKAFAPGVRSSVAIIRMQSKDEGFDFCSEWKSLADKDVSFNGSRLRARTDQSPAQRKMNAKVYHMTDYFKTKFQDKQFDADFKQGIVWADEGELVKWSMTSEDFVWGDEVLASGGYDIDKVAAIAHAAQP